MDIYVIGDENTVLGFSLIGVDGKVVRSVDEAQSALEEAVDEEGLKIVLVSEDWAAVMRDKVNRLKREVAEPLVLEVPGRALQPTGPSLRELVEEAIGVRVGGGRGG